MRRILLLTDDEYFFRKAELLTAGEALLYRLEGKEAPDATARVTEYEGGRVLCISDGTGERRLPLPAKLSELKAALCGVGEGARLKLLPEDGAAILDGVRIRFTETEFSLLSLLADAKGGYVSRDEIMKRVFNSAGGGIINVYIHYLREKLERGGEKIILSSRSEGYRIDEKFLKGDGYATAY